MVWRSRYRLAAPVGLDPDHHFRWLLRPGGDQLVQPGHACHPVGDTLAGQHAPVGSHHAHVMVALGPIDPDQQHGGSFLVSIPALGLEGAAAT
jgi:hypothetical protein